MAAKTATEPSYDNFLTELTALMSQQDKFKSGVQELICECEMLDKVEETFFLFINW